MKKREEFLLNVTRLLCGSPSPGDGLRYGEPPPKGPGAFSSQQKVHHRPVVVWNVTRQCNLRCEHCYVAATEHRSPKELTRKEALEVVRDLAQFEVPAILFSGGEPLMRTDLFELMQTAHDLGAVPVLSTNGTLLTDEIVSLLCRSGVKRVGISLDGLEGTNDHFRGVTGAFRRALDGIRSCREAGIRVSLRFTLTQHNAQDLEGIFELVEREEIPRLCIYHLAYAGRGRRLLPQDLTNQECREILVRIFQSTIGLHRQGADVEVLTVANHADGPYLLLWAQEHTPERVPEINRLLTANGGNSSGLGIGCIDERGVVHPDQFWRTSKLGNVRVRSFSKIWQDKRDPLLQQLRNRKRLLTERCRNCRFLPLCNGNLRERAEAATGDIWGMDPACYLSEEEIGAVSGLSD